ncbi:uncharacterized protein PAC_05323 [Phialocephala subalpina]|uniref:BTB domain-containing protein n=1 Tax=Phialocephala subalpina TaxID=576137 RepID=A0A1L7WRR6_9HELO|nr:uncharacterized protein PAC_05323 [Phialocephala subalpina]
MAPPNKKKKTGDVGAVTQVVLKPISFATPGLAADISLKVFDQEFLVHSALLKIHSKFFLKFLDSPDKIAAKTQDLGDIQYRWITKMDNDSNGWHLVAVPSNGDNDLSGYKGDSKHQERCFHKLICAIYTRPYVIYSFKCLQTLVELADYYRALPIVSRTLDSVLLNGDKRNICVREDCYDILALAAKLRNKLLFREALIHIVGSTDEADSYEGSLEDPRLSKICRNARYEILALVGQAYQEILNLRDDTMAKEVSRIAKDARDTSAGGDIYIPLYFKKLHYKGLINVADLMKNNLVLRRNEYDIEHDDNIHDDYPDSFFCGKIDDEDLPWDTTEQEW